MGRPKGNKGGYVFYDKSRKFLYYDTKTLLFNLIVV